MSEASTATPATDKTESKGSTAAPATDKTESNGSSDSSDTSTSSKSSAPNSEKSARDSVGGKSEVHYGYFSNVKTPEFRSGWDSIWGGGKTNGASKEKAVSKPARSKTPVRLNLAFEDLPEAVQDELRKTAASALKRSSRLNFARRDEAGAVSWSIKCEVRR